MRTAESLLDPINTTLGSIKRDGIFRHPLSVATFGPLHQYLHKATRCPVILTYREKATQRYTAKPPGVLKT